MVETETTSPSPERGRPPGVQSASRGERFRARIGELEPLGVGADEAAALVGIGKTLWAELDSAGQIPAPRKLGTRCVWAVAELRDWMGAGCPERERWETLKKS